MEKWFISWDRHGYMGDCYIYILDRRIAVAMQEFRSCLHLQDDMICTFCNNECVVLSALLPVLPGVTSIQTCGAAGALMLLLLQSTSNPTGTIGRFPTYDIPEWSRHLNKRQSKVGRASAYLFACL